VWNEKAREKKLEYDMNMLIHKENMRGDSEINGTAHAGSAQVATTSHQAPQRKESSDLSSLDGGNSQKQSKPQVSGILAQPPVVNTNGGA
jgi:hypothetical protein